MEAYEREWLDLSRRMVEACLRLRLGRSPEEDAAREVAEEWVRLSLERAEKAIALFRIEEAHRIEEATREEAEARAALEAMFPEEA